MKNILLSIRAFTFTKISTGATRTSARIFVKDMHKVLFTTHVVHQTRQRKKIIK